MFGCVYIGIGIGLVILLIIAYILILLGTRRQSKGLLITGLVVFTLLSLGYVVASLVLFNQFWNIIVMTITIFGYKIWVILLAIGGIQEIIQSDEKFDKMKMSDLSS